MHYLVTGGCGFIGSHLSERLLVNGHQVTIMDDLSNGVRENAPEHARLLIADITTPGVFDALVDQVDGCFHLAAIASVQMTTEQWLKTHRVNLGGTVALFDAMIRHKRRIPVVFASSAAVYGTNQNIPLAETAVCRPFSVYGADKLACEWHAAIAANTHHIPTIGLRLFNIYGSRQNPLSPYSGVISIFMHRIVQNLPITIFGDGEQSRDFVYVDDAVSGLCAAMQKLETRAMMHGIFNLCTGTQTSVNSLAQVIATITGSQSEIIHTTPRVADIRLSLGDPDLGRQMLGFNASCMLDEGLRKMQHNR